MALTTINSSGIKDDSLVNADIKSDAAIAGSKLVAATTSVSGSMSAADKTKLDGVATSATANPSAPALTGSTNNTICTVTGANAIQGEANLTFDGTNLGVGITPVPQDTGATTFHVHDSTATERAHIRLTTDTSGTAADNGGFIGIDNNPDFYIYNQENGNLRFGTNGSERLRIDSSGNVKCGGWTDSNSWGSKLQVGGGYIAVDQGSGSPWILGKNSSDQDFILGRVVADGTITENFRAHANGNLKINDGDLVIGTAGHGIDFSAQTASSATGATTADETLDHYETGTWTPYDNSGAGLTFPTVGTARYIRVGNLVQVNFYVTYPTTSNSSTAIIGGLPFNQASGYHFMVCRVSGAGSDTAMFQLESSGAYGYILLGINFQTNANLSGNSILASGTYYCA